jgi:methyl-accepting chemotaxis protein
VSSLKVHTRINLLIACLSSILVLIGVLGLYDASKSNEALDRVYRDRVIALEQLGEIRYLVQRNRVLVMDMLLQPEQSNVKKRFAELGDNEQKINGLWTEYLSRETSDNEANLAKEFHQAFLPYRQEGIQPAAQSMIDVDATTAMDIYKGKISPLAPAMQKQLHKLNQVHLDESKLEYEYALKRYAFIRNITLTSIFFGVCLAFLFGYLLSKGLRAQLGGEPSDAQKVAKHVTAGDLAFKIDILHGDKHSLMANLKEMQVSLEGIVRNVRSCADSLSHSTFEISHGNLELARRTESQANSLEITASSMKQLSSSVRHNAESSIKANQLANMASEVAQKAGNVVAQVVQTMGEINQSSRRISEIIGVIDGIAFQTNILALNAAVEAARAGEQGRGFAVVASEVRSLAGRSASAAKEIKGLINASVERVEHGTSLVDSAGITMSEVVDSIHQVTSLMSTISEETTEQAKEVDQIRVSVQQMDQSTQANSALVEEISATSDALKLQAISLVEAVQVFKLRSVVFPESSTTLINYSKEPNSTSNYDMLIK